MSFDEKPSISQVRAVHFGFFTIDIIHDEHIVRISIKDMLCLGMYEDRDAGESAS